MKTKILEVRDSATFIPVVCVDMNPEFDPHHVPDTQYLLSRAGYACDGRPIIMFTRADGGGKACYDPYEWGDRTFHVAHNYITENWGALKDGDVVDVEFILGETREKKTSERLG